MSVIPSVLHRKKDIVNPSMVHFAEIGAKLKIFPAAMAKATPAAFESLFGLEFKAVDEARAALDAVSEPLGCRVVVQRTEDKNIELQCSKGRSFRPQGNPDLPDSKRHKTSSQMARCPYSLVITRPHSLGSWRI